MIYESGVYLHHSSILFSPILDGKVTIFSLAISSIRIKALLLLLSFSVMFNSLWPYGLHGCQASLSFTISWNLLKLMSIESVMPSNHLILFSCLQSFPASGSFPMSQFFSSGGQSIGVSASASVLQMNIQDWFPLGWTGCISLQSKGLSRVFSNTAVQKHPFFSTQLSL